jgi:hypothetical protein
MKFVIRQIIAGIISFLLAVSMFVLMYLLYMKGSSVTGYVDWRYGWMGMACCMVGVLILAMSVVLFCAAADNWHKDQAIMRSHRRSL